MRIVLGFAPRSAPARLARTPKPHRRFLGCHHPHRKSSAVNARYNSIDRRWIGSQIAKSTVGSPYACTWLTTTPEEITPDDILTSSPTTKLDSGLNYTPVILATPAFASWVDPSHPFLAQWMNRVYHTASRPLEAIIAIVDRLPDTRINDIQGADYDGLSILFVKSGTVQGKPAPSRQIRSMEVEEPALVFSVRTDHVDAPSDACHGHSHDVGLRLANTIFVNGKQNTLFVNRWAPSPASNKLILEQSVDLSACMVTLTSKGVKNSLQLPLHPVGQRRKVISSMGNILRQIGKHADGRSDEPMPASSELEKELPRYIAERGIPGQRVSVWALIETLEESPYINSGYTQSGLAKSIQMGGKLHRVMSGGGGWGKKQGLLSLDPETSFSQADSSNMVTVDHILSSSTSGLPQSEPLAFQKGIMLEDLSTLSQAASPGDYVQFFASVAPSDLQRPQPDSPLAEGGDLSCLFGVVSDAESVPSQIPQRRSLEVTPNCFGALTEKGITFTQPLFRSETGEVLESHTKLDIPSCRVELVLK